MGKFVNDKKGKFKRIMIVVNALATVYVSIYVALSFAGTYRPGTVGVMGIKDWYWSPKYFADESGRMRGELVYPFLPLFWLDKLYWHNDWSGESGPRDATIPSRIPTY